jgi:hypothetical protein
MDQPLELFTCFNNLIPVIQDKTFACSQPHDKNNWQKTNKEWYKRGSINVPAVYKLAMHDPFCASETDKTRILLSACYNKQYHIVQNILNQTDNRTPFHYIHGAVVWDLYGVAEHTQDQKMLQLLNDNKVCSLVENKEVLRELWNARGIISTARHLCKPTNLQMACFAGDSERTRSLIGIEDVYLASCIIAYMDSADCLKVLLDTRNKQSDIVIDPQSRSNIAHFLDEYFLDDTCKHKSLRVLRLLLDDKKFDVNKIRCRGGYVKNPRYTTLRSFIDYFRFKLRIEDSQKSQYVEIINMLEERIRRDKSKVVSRWNSFCENLNSLENAFL